MDVPRWVPDESLLQNPHRSHMGCPYRTHIITHLGPIWVPHSLLAVLLLKNCSTRINLFIPVFRYFIYPHLCKITTQLLLYILRYCIKTMDTLFSFSPRNVIFTHFLVNFCYFGMTNTSLFAKFFPSKTANPFFHLLIHLFIYIYLFI